MKRTFLLCLLSLFMVGSALAQPSVHLLTPANGINPSTLATEQSLVFSVDPAALATAYASPHFIATGVRIPTPNGAVTMSLDVSEFTVFGPETRFIEQHGNTITELPLPSVKLYRGHVVGSVGSFAYIAITPNGNVSGLVKVDGADYTIGYPKGQPMTSMITAAAAIPHFSDATRCELTDEASYDFKSSQKYIAERGNAPRMSTQSVQVATKTAIVAFDIDFACYQSYGGVQEVQDYLTSTMGAITSVYESEVDMAMQLGTVKVWTTPDPYSGGDINSLLSSFTNTWNTIPGNSSISRTMVHLMDNKLGSGNGAQGLAWLDVMCDPDHGFGVTNATGNTNLPIIDQEVMAHELGHNVGSAHTHNCTFYPPNGIDHCVANDGGGSCSWTPVQTKGTIMSYCNNKDFTFHARVRDTLRARIDVAPCLASLASISVKLDSLNFPATPTYAKRDTVLKDVVKSAGSVPLKILGVQLIAFDANDSEFTLVNPPAFPVTLAAGKSQSLTVRFHPGSQGQNVGILIIYHNAEGGSDTIYLNGTGTVPQVNQLNSSFDFGDITDRLKHDTTVEFLSNWGDAPLVLTSFKIDGPDAGLFTASPVTTLPVMIDPNDTTSVKISFTGSANGLKTAVLKVATNDQFQDTVTLYMSATVSGLGVANTPLPVGVSLTISPNPTSSMVHVNLAGLEAYAPGEITASLFDATGKRVATLLHSTSSSPNISFDWLRPRTLASGSYTLLIEGRTLRITRSIVIE